MFIPLSGTNAHVYKRIYIWIVIVIVLTGGLKIAFAVISDVFSLLIVFIVDGFLETPTSETVVKIHSSLIFKKIII